MTKTEMIELLRTTEADLRAKMMQADDLFGLNHQISIKRTRCWAVVDRLLMKMGIQPIAYSDIQASII